MNAIKIFVSCSSRDTGGQNDLNRKLTDIETKELFAGEGVGGDGWAYRHSIGFIHIHAAIYPLFCTRFTLPEVKTAVYPTGNTYVVLPNPWASLVALNIDKALYKLILDQERGLEQPEIR